MADGGHGHLGRSPGGAIAGSVSRVKGPRSPARGIGTLETSDPTDPEVPAAKRLRAARRKRSLVLAAAAIAALLCTLFALLYRMEQQVTTGRPASLENSPKHEDSNELSGGPMPGIPPARLDSLGAAETGASEQVLVPGATNETAAPRPGSTFDDAVRVGNAPGRAGPTGSGRPAPNPRSTSAPEIFRRPAF
jgi:hypothetical protein